MAAGSLIEKAASGANPAPANLLTKLTALTDPGAITFDPTSGTFTSAFGQMAGQFNAGWQPGFQTDADGRGGATDSQAAYYSATWNDPNSNQFRSFLATQNGTGGYDLTTDVGQYQDISGWGDFLQNTLKMAAYAAALATGLPELVGPAGAAGAGAAAGAADVGAAAGAADAGAAAGATEASSAGVDLASALNPYTTLDPVVVTGTRIADAGLSLGDAAAGAAGLASATTLDPVTAYGHRPPQPPSIGDGLVPIGLDALTNALPNPVPNPAAQPADNSSSNLPQILTMPQMPQLPAGGGAPTPLQGALGAGQGVEGVLHAGGYLGGNRGVAGTLLNAGASNSLDALLNLNRQTLLT